MITCRKTAAPRTWPDQEHYPNHDKSLLHISGLNKDLLQALTLVQPVPFVKEKTNEVRKANWLEGPI